MQEFPTFKIPLVPYRYAQLFQDYLEESGCNKDLMVNYEQRLQSYCQNTDQSLSLDQVSDLLSTINGEIDAAKDGFNFGTTIDLDCLGVVGYISSTQDNPLQQLAKVTQLMNTSLPLFSFSIRFDAKSAHLAVGNCVRLDGLKVFLLFAYLGCIYQICSRFSRIKMINIGNNVDVDLSHLKVAAPNVTWLSGGSEVSVLLTDIILPRNKPITNMSVIPSDNSRQQKCNIDDEALVEQVEGIVKESPGRMTIVRCAERFGVSARYLRYKLEDRGITFREIKAKVLHEQANLYLFHSKLSVSDISFKLGFANHASFSRAYKAVTGVAPGENRRNFLVELDNA